MILISDIIVQPCAERKSQIHMYLHDHVSIPASKQKAGEHTHRLCDITLDDVLTSLVLHITKYFFLEV